MPLRNTRSKPSTSGNTKLKVDSSTSILNALGDPSKCDDELARRLANALNVTEPIASVRQTVKRKIKAEEAMTNYNERRRLAMAAANVASQSLGIVVRSGWKALNHDGTPGFSMDSILSIVSSFRTSISLLRELMPRVIDVERVVSAFISKVITVQLYEIALELLQELKSSVIQFYLESPCESTLTKPSAPRTAKSPPLSQYLDLIQYPLPPPSDGSLLGVIGIALAQALSALAALVSQLPPGDSVLEIFASTLEGDCGILYWHSFLPEEHADSVVTRAHRTLAMTFSSSNTAPVVLLRLRTWALRCLLLKASLDSDSFWTQSANYLASHRKSINEAKGGVNFERDAMTFFDVLVSIAQQRQDPTTFLFGPGFIKFCEFALVSAQRGKDVSCSQRIVRLIKNASDGLQNSSDFPVAQLYVVFNQGAKNLEKFLNSASEEDLVDSLTQCTEALPAIPTLFTASNLHSNAMRSLERLRRLCCKVLEEGKGVNDLRYAVKLLLLGFIDSIEAGGHEKATHITAEATSNLMACVVDSVTVLAKDTFSLTKSETHSSAYEYLQRGVALIEAHQTPLSKDMPKFNAACALGKIWRSISGAFWNLAVVLYQDDKYATAARFLKQACMLGARACEMVRYADGNDYEPGHDPKSDIWTMLTTHLPKRWELLADCYSRIGDRKFAHGALIESLKAYSFESLGDLASSLSPSQICLDPGYSRLFSLIERITHVAVSDLLMTDKASLRHTLCTSDIGPQALGVLLEWQATGLEENLWKPESRAVTSFLLRDALDLYDDQFPVRRARVLLRQLELAYHTDDFSVSVTATVSEIDMLLSKSLDTGKDSALSGLRMQYRATAYMWMAFHSHRGSEGHGHTSTVIVQHATLAGKILRGIFPAASHSVLVKSPKRSPKVGSGQAFKTATRTSPRKKPAATKLNPVTPKPRKKAMQTPPRLKQKPASKSESVTKHASAADPGLAKIVEMLAQLLGLLGHIPLKIQFLNILQRMAEPSSERSANEFIRASVDAAAEYLSLGKVRRALAIHAHALAAIDDAPYATVADEVRISLLLHYAEALVVSGNTDKSARLYEEARILAQSLESPQPRSTAGRIRARVMVLEQSALASRVFSLIQTAQDGPLTVLSSLRRSLRLWNRAFDSLARLSPSPDPASSNPFDMASMVEALPTLKAVPSPKEEPGDQRRHRRRMITGMLQWRVAQGLLHILFALARAYFLQGSVRGAEYFIDQVRDLAESLSSPAMVSRALAKKGELQLHQGNIREAAACIMEAAGLLCDLPGVDAADVTRLRARHSQLLEQDNEAKTLYQEATSMISDLEATLSSVDSVIPGARKSLAQSPGRSSDLDVLAPGLLAMVLKQQIWLQRNEPRSETTQLLERLSSLPPSVETKSEELAILAKLALHDAHVQFRADLFLSSLTESTIAVPMGLSSNDSKCLLTGGKQMLEALSTAETMFWANLESVFNRGHVLHAREAAVSLAFIQSLKTSLGQRSSNDARVATALLDASAAITLRREFIDAIDQKFSDVIADDQVWLCTSDRSRMTAESKRSVASNKANDEQCPVMDLEEYWDSVRARHHSHHDSVSMSQVDSLPANWTVISVSMTEDKSSMFFARQRPHREPLLFCVPLERHGRKEENADKQFVFNDAMQQFGEILRESDQSAKDAKDVPSEDREAKAAWWAKRVLLDKRMRELLDNIEFCWLGAFKTIFHEPVETPSEILNNFRARLDKVFHRTLASEKKRASRMRLDDALVECFASLPPQCRDEELEDLVYFVLDLYQFHGIHVALSEIDIDQVTVELRTVLEEHTAKARGRVVPVKDAHLFLVLDKNVQGIPWESIPVLRGRSVSRVPSLAFLVDRIEFAHIRRRSMGLSIVDGLPLDRAVVNPKSTYYILNPSGDLTKSQARFGAWVKDMEVPAVGWQGIVGRAPNEQELLEAFTHKDLVIYIGHGGAEQYVRSNKIKHLPRCAATMLWGCSSGLMRDMGDFDRTGTPYNYMMAGCPTLVACLWDVTDNDLDKFSRSVFEKLRLDVEKVRSWNEDSVEDASTSIVSAVGQSRDVCKLKYLTGAAPVVYGIPFYL